MIFSTQMSQINTYTWKSWIRGLNTLQSPLNIRNDELAIATNIILTDEGQPVRRDGTANFGDSLNSTSVPMLIPHYSKAGINKLLAIADGRGWIRNDSTGAWATVTSGASWPSSQRYNWSMLNNVTYITGDADPLTKFDGTYLTRFTTITKPTGLAGARGGSLASGQFQLSYKITAENAIGETDASTAVIVAVNRDRDQWNFNPDTPDLNYSVNLTWNAASEATKYNIYGINSGTETYIDSVEGGGLSYRDYGLKVPSTLFSAPTGNSTDAPRGEYVKTHKSSLFIAGDPNEPSRLYFSAGVDKPDSFTISDGGGFIDVNRNADDGVISGLGTYQDSLIVFKEYSIWKFDFTTSLLPSLSNIRQGLGCVSHKTIVPIENDLFFVGKTVGGTPALYVLGNEPNYLSVLRTNEISSRVRPEITLIYSNYKKATAIYNDNKYHFFYADGSNTTNNKALIYDRQRLGFTAWEGLNVENPLVWRNSSSAEKSIYSDGSTKRVKEISDSFDDDNGTPISWEIRTKQEQNKQLSLEERTKWVNFVLKQPQGSLTFKFYHNDDETDIVQNLGSRDMNTAFGYWQFGEGAQFGTTGASSDGGSGLSVNQKFPIHRLGNSTVSSSFGIGLAGDSATSKATLLSLEFQRKEMSKNKRNLSDVYQI